MKTKDKEQIIAKAREFIGTPYLHQGRVKGAGIDCCGLVIQVAKELGLSDYDLTGYSRYADGVDFLKEFFEQCRPQHPTPNPQHPTPNTQLLTLRTG